ncbi:MAG: hypothetical protein JWP78_3354 [Mucilaginibacter sp.]|nr:hypothetical protein [Mucilaginibacter sp.]
MTTMIGAYYGKADPRNGILTHPEKAVFVSAEGGS